MNKRFLLVLILCGLLGWGCQKRVSPFTLTYMDETGGLDFKTSPYFEKPDGYPVVIESFPGNIKKDETQLENDGYVLIGRSSFNAQSQHEHGVTQQAKKVGAARALWYNKHTHTETTTGRSLYSSQPKYDSSGTIVGFNNKYRDETYKTMYFDHGASYWAKVSDRVIRLGVAVKDHTQNQQQGMEIVGVRKDSPAAQAGLQKGDILRRIGEVKIYNRGAFLRALKKYAGTITQVVFLQNGEEFTRDIKLNTGMTIEEPFDTVIRLR